LRAAGTTILLTTHDMQEADRLCRRIAIVDHGKLIALDTPAGLRDLLPGARGLEVTVACDDDPAAAFAHFEQVETSPVEDRWQVRLYGPSATPARALAAVETLRSAEVIDLRRIEGTLEDVFVHLTGRDLR
jgi:ABC-2 type transport system ATP-binding protein